MKKVVQRLLVIFLCLAMLPIGSLANEEMTGAEPEEIAEEIIEVSDLSDLEETPEAKNEPGTDSEESAAEEDAEAVEAEPNEPMSDFDKATLSELEESDEPESYKSEDLTYSDDVILDLDNAVAENFFELWLDGVSRDDAVNWLVNQEGVWYDLDGKYGAQCSDFVSAYMNWLYSGEVSPYQGYAVYNASDYPTVASWNTSRWDVYSNTSSFVPEPGDIYVQTGHVGVFLSGSKSSARVIDQNSWETWALAEQYGGSGRAARIYNTSISDSTHFIRFKNFNSTLFTLDVNGLLDGGNSGNISGFGTFDIYINGQLAGNDVNDYYRTDLPAGTTYNICEIKPLSGKAYGGVSSGSRTGTVNANTDVRLVFTTIPSSTGVEPIVSTYNGHTYYYVARNSSWYAAKYFCEKMGGHLVTISNAGENEFVWNLTGKKSTWVGATDQAKEGTWKWVSGETLSYSNWADGEPNNTSSNNDSNENYAHLTGGGKWNDAPGCTLYGFVCEFDMAYTISYDANGGTGAPSAQTKPYGAALALSTTKPTRSGYTFLGWAASSTAKTAEYQPGGTYSADKEITLYAIWVEGSIGAWSPTKPTGVDDSLIITSTQYRYAEKQDSEWKQSASGTIDYVSSWPSGFDKSNSLYSQYNKSIKSASESSTKKVAVSSSQIGWIYWHWCAGYQYGPVNRLIEDCYTSARPNFHAFYSAETAGHSDPNGVNGGDCFYFYNRDACRDTYWWFGLPVYRQTWTEYTRASDTAWGPWSEWSDTKYESSSTRKVESRTVYAVITPNSYTVTYNANGGTGAPASQTKTHGTALTLSSTKPTRSGYTFQGWATSSTATTAQYQPGGSYTNNANVTLYAVWKANAAAAPTVAITSDARTAQITGDFTGLYARVALVISTGGQSGLYVTQATVNPDGSVVIPQFMVPGLTVTGVNIALVRSITDIPSATPSVVTSAFKML